MVEKRRRGGTMTWGEMKLEGWGKEREREENMRSQKEKIRDKDRKSEICYRDVRGFSYMPTRNFL